MKFPIRFSALLTGVSTLAFAAAVHALDAKDIYEAMGFSEEQQQKIAGGEFVTADVKTTADTALASGMAFQVPVEDDVLVKELQAGLLNKVDENVKAHGEFKGEGSLADFAGLVFSADELEGYENAKAGSDLNLSTAEIAALRAAGKAGIEEAVKEMLLGRLRDYRAKGLAGLAPYDRGSGDAISPAEELKSAVENSHFVKKFAPAFYDVLAGYPAGKGKVTERFTWAHLEAHGTPVVVLVHGMSMKAEDFYVVSQRQYYVSATYNVEQAVAGLFPVKGGTAVVYGNRTYTDQVTGFGGSAKRSIGSKLLASQLEGIFKRFSKAAGK